MSPNTPLITGNHILVTGGLGAIGSGLTRELLKRGAGSITILDDCSSSSKEVCKDILKDKRVEFIEDSIVNDAALKKAFAKSPTVVFHLAANFANQNSVDHPVKDCEVNSVGTTKVLEWSRNAKTKKFIFASSSCIYGNASNFAVDSIDFRPETPYAVNKLHGEYLVKFYHEYHKLDTTILRFFNSFGPGELPGRYRNVIPNFFALAMRGIPLPITGDETTSRDFNYIGNTVSATLLAVDSPVSSGKIYNVGSGKEVTIVELAKTINELTGNDAGIIMKPMRRWDTIKHRKADIGLTVTELKYEPQVDFKKHLKETYEWLHEHKDLFPEQ